MSVARRRLALPCITLYCLALAFGKVRWSPGHCHGTQFTDPWRQHQHSLSGEITTGRYYDGGYYDDMDCRFHLRVASGTIRLKITAFEFQARDELRIYDGGTQDDSKRLFACQKNANGNTRCNLDSADFINNPVLDFTSTGREMYIVATSDAEDVAGGFIAQWTNLQPTSVCLTCALPSQSCTVDRQCPFGYTCEPVSVIAVAGTATKPPLVCTASSFGLPCTPSSEKAVCSRGLVCIGERCSLPRSIGDSCPAAAQGTNYGCGPAGGVCVDGRCVSRGSRTIGQDCSRTSDCIDHETGNVLCIARDPNAPMTMTCGPPPVSGEICMPYSYGDAVETVGDRNATLVFDPPVDSTIKPGVSDPTPCALGSDGITRLSCRLAAPAPTPSDPTPPPTPSTSKACLNSILSGLEDVWKGCDTEVLVGGWWESECQMGGGILSQADVNKCKRTCYTKTCTMNKVITVKRPEFRCFDPVALGQPCDLTQNGRDCALASLETGARWRHTHATAYERVGAHCVAGGLDGSSNAAVCVSDRSIPDNTVIGEVRVGAELSRGTTSGEVHGWGNETKHKLCASGHFDGRNNRCLPPPPTAGAACQRDYDCVGPAYDAVTVRSFRQRDAVSKYAHATTDMAAALSCECDLGETTGKCRDLRAESRHGGEHCAAGEMTHPQLDNHTNCCANATSNLERCIATIAVPGALDAGLPAQDVTQARFWLMQSVMHQMRYPYDEGVALHRKCLGYAFVLTACTLHNKIIEHRRCILNRTLAHDSTPGAVIRGGRMVAPTNRALELLIELSKLRQFAGPQAWPMVKEHLGIPDPPPSPTPFPLDNFEILLCLLGFVAVSYGSFKLVRERKRRQEEEAARKIREAEEAKRRAEEERLQREKEERERRKREIAQKAKEDAANAAANAAAAACGAAAVAKKRAQEAIEVSAATIPMEGFPSEAENEQRRFLESLIKDGVHKGQFKQTEVVDLRSEFRHLFPDSIIAQQGTVGARLELARERGRVSDNAGCAPDLVRTFTCGRRDDRVDLDAATRAVDGVAESAGGLLPTGQLRAMSKDSVPSMDTCASAHATSKRKGKLWFRRGGGGAAKGQRKVLPLQ